MGSETLKYVFLGIIQGLTEFLPISSSGHLVIFHTLLGIGENVAFDTVVHLATALAVVIYFWKDILYLLSPRSGALARKMLWLLIVGTFSTAVIGFTFRDFFESLFSSVPAVGGFLFLTGIILLLGEWLGKGKRKLEEMNTWDAILIGLAQGAAIAPGLSRSGTTISASLARKLERTLAARFSFLLAIPTILGAGILQSKAIVRAGTLGIGGWALLSGFAAAFVSGWLAIKLFMNMIQRASFRVFAYYCFVAGTVALLLSYFLL